MTDAALTYRSHLPLPLSAFRRGGIPGPSAGPAMTPLPRRFALVQHADEARKTVGYGLILPDGSTFCVPWPSRGNWFYSSDNPERIASLVDAEIEYLDRGVKAGEFDYRC